MLLLLLPTALAGTNTHTDGTTTIVRDGSDVVSVETADAALEVLSEADADTMLLAGAVTIDGPVLALGDAVWLDLDEKKALGVAWKDGDRSFAVDGLLDDGGEAPVGFNLGVILEKTSVINLSVGWHPLCATEDGFGLDGTLWKSDDSIVAIQTDAATLTIWTAPEQSGDSLWLVGAAFFEDDLIDGQGSVVLEEVKGEVIVQALDGSSKDPSYATLTQAPDPFEVVWNLGDTAPCGALLEFQIPEK